MDTDEKIEIINDTKEAIERKKIFLENNKKAFERFKATIKECDKKLYYDNVEILIGHSQLDKLGIPKRSRKLIFDFIVDSYENELKDLENEIDIMKMKLEYLLK